MRTGSRSARLSYSVSSAPDVTIAVSGEEGPGLRKLGSLNSVARLVHRGDCSWADSRSASADDRPSRAPSAQRERAGSRSVYPESGRLRTRGGNALLAGSGADARVCRIAPLRTQGQVVVAGPAAAHWPSAPARSRSECRDEADPHAVRVGLPPSALGEVCRSARGDTRRAAKGGLAVRRPEGADGACGCSASSALGRVRRILDVPVHARQVRGLKLSLGQHDHDQVVRGIDQPRAAETTVPAERAAGVHSLAERP